MSMLIFPMWEIKFLEISLRLDLHLHQHLEAYSKICLSFAENVLFKRISV